MGTYGDRGEGRGARGDEGVIVEAGDYTALQERLAALEWTLETMDWRLLSAQTDQEFSRPGLNTITEFSRIMAVKNPLVKRGVTVQRLYVFGQGFTVRAEEPALDDALTAFYEDPKNAVELSQQELSAKEVELQVSGNLFFCLFVNRTSGRVRVRTVQFEEIQDVVCDPNDAKTPWYYRRAWTENGIDLATGAQEMRSREAYYPDWRYDPVSKPERIGSLPVMWESPIFHVKVGSFPHWKFGLSEVYASIDWAKAYKEFLEDWASIVRAYRRFAFQLSQPGGKSAVMAAKNKLASSVGTDGASLTDRSALRTLRNKLASSVGTDGAVSNPAPVVGSTFIAGENVKLEAVRTSGATVSAEDGRRLLLMVAASLNLPETFFGDASVGSLATAKSLDRPTELGMKDRQSLWADVLNGLHDFVLFWQVKAPQGSLRGLGTVERVVEEGAVFERVVWNADVSPRVETTFPPLVQADAPAMIGAMVDAATLRGQALAGTVDLRTLAAMLLSTLGVTDVDQVVDRMFPDGETGREGEMPATEAAMVEAVRELREAIGRLGA